MVEPHQEKEKGTENSEFNRGRLQFKIRHQVKWSGVGWHWQRWQVTIDRSIFLLSDGKIKENFHSSSSPYITCKYTSPISVCNASSLFLIGVEEDLCTCFDGSEGGSREDSLWMFPSFSRRFTGKGHGQRTECLAFCIPVNYTTINIDIWGF